MSPWLGRRLGGLERVPVCRGPPRAGSLGERGKTGLQPGLPKHRRRQRRTRTCNASLAGWRTDSLLCRGGLRSPLAGERHRERRVHGRWRWLSTTSEASHGFLRTRARVI